MKQNTIDHIKTIGYIGLVIIYGAIVIGLVVTFKEYITGIVGVAMTVAGLAFLYSEIFKEVRAKNKREEFANASKDQE